MHECIQLASSEQECLNCQEKRAEEATMEVVEQINSNRLSPTLQAEVLGLISDRRADVAQLQAGVLHSSQIDWPRDCRVTP